MNETFKTELAAFARDLNAMCNGFCFTCPMGDAEKGVCGVFVPSHFDTDKAIAAVEAYRKQKKPCAEVIDRAVDIYQLEVEIDCIPKGCYVPSATACSEKLRQHIEWYYGHNKWTTVRVLSAKRFVLESHRERGGEEEDE